MSWIFYFAISFDTRVYFLILFFNKVFFLCSILALISPHSLSKSYLLIFYLESILLVLFSLLYLAFSYTFWRNSFIWSSKSGLSPLHYLRASLGLYPSCAQLLALGGHFLTECRRELRQDCVCSPYISVCPQGYSKTVSFFPRTGDFLDILCSFYSSPNPVPIVRIKTLPSTVTTEYFLLLEGWTVWFNVPAWCPKCSPWIITGPSECLWMAMIPVIVIFQW